MIPMNLRPEIQAFAELMQIRFDEKAAQHNFKDEWKNDDVIYLLRHFKEEVHEFTSAYFTNQPELINEGVDVALMVMMVLDNMRKLKY